MSVDVYPPRAASTPSAVLAYVPVTNTQSGIVSTPVALAGYVAAVFAPGGRYLRISLQGHLYQSANNMTTEGESAVIKCYRNGVYLAQSQHTHRLRGDHSTEYHWEVIDVPPRGPAVYTFTIERAAAPAAQSIFHRASIDGEQGYVLVEDITGGTGGPGPILLGKAEDIVSRATTGGTELVVLTVPVNVPAGRSIRVRGVGNVSRSIADGTTLFAVKEGATFLFHAVKDGLANETLTPERTVNPTPGAHTYTLTVQNYSGTGVSTVNANANQPMQLIVEDVTGTEAPTGAYYEALWTPVAALLNGWVNHTPGVYPVASYRKVNDLLYVRGLVKNGTVANATQLFQLPVGYRPVYTQHIPAVTNDLPTFCRVQNDGYVTIGAGVSSAWFSLDGVVASLGA